MRHVGGCLVSHNDKEIIRGRDSVFANSVLPNLQIRCKMLVTVCSVMLVTIHSVILVTICLVFASPKYAHSPFPTL